MNGRRRNKNGCCFADRVKNCFGKKQCKSVVSKLSKRGDSGRVKVCKITGDRKVCARMASMGLYPGAEADIICATGGNQCLLKLNGGTISVDSDVTDNVYVTNL
ncbi:MAG: ferrous iron transport protein A [Desulfobulbaceae bacterium]|nr:ferrous iron transport protein A [Desulfobulbaceae bacterium]